MPPPVAVVRYVPVTAADGAQRSVSAAEHGLYSGHYSVATGFSLPPCAQSALKKVGKWFI